MDTQPQKTGDSAASPAIARLSGVSVTLAGNAGPVEILKEIDLAIDAGSTNAVVGPSGSGKTQASPSGSIETSSGCIPSATSLL